MLNFYEENSIASTAEPVLNFSNGVVEVLRLHIKSDNLVLIAVYRQPDNLGGGHRSTSVEFRQALTEIKSLMTNLPTPTPDIVLCGDFNLPHLTWPEGTLRPGASRDEQIMAKDLIDLTHEQFLFQQITEPTHRQGNTLDLCFSNNPAFVHSYQCCWTLFSDHYIIEGCSTYSKFHRPQSYRQPHWSAGPGAEFDKLNFMSEEADSLGQSRTWAWCARLEHYSCRTRPWRNADQTPENLCQHITKIHHHKNSSLSGNGVTERLVEYLTSVGFLCAGDVKLINRCQAPNPTPRKTN